MPDTGNEPQTLRIILRYGQDGLNGDDDEQIFTEYKGDCISMVLGACDAE